MTTLYELSKQFKEVLELAQDDDDFVGELEACAYDFKTKAIDCIKYAKDLEAQAMAIKSATEAMIKRQKQMEKRAEDVRRYVLENMQATEMKTIECEYFKVTRKKNPPSVVVVDEDSVPAEFKTVKTVMAVDKYAIKAAGGCNGAIIVQNESLSIR